MAKIMKVAHRFKTRLLPAVALALPTLITLLWHSSHAATAGSAATLLSSREHVGGGNSNRLQIGIAVGVSAKPEHLVNLLTMLVPSWNLLRTHPAAEGVALDLLVFCEDGSCLELPSECRPMRSADGRLFAHDQVSNCWFTEQDAAANEDWKHYVFMSSIAFLMQPEMLEIASRYDKLMRTDEDGFLTPRLLMWRPPHEAMFGTGGHSHPFNEQRLPQIAKKYGLRHQGVTNICSTWLVPPQLALQVANMTLDIGRRLYDEEWDMTLPGLADKVGQEDWSEDGKWPDWWRGVVSLYAAELAINHLLPDLKPTHVTDEIDHGSHEETPIANVVHVHASHDGLPFSKFDFHDSLTKLLTANSAQQRRTDFAKEPLAVTDDMQVRQYAHALTQRAVRSTSAISMFAAG